jgi:hypothetical protein
MSATTDFSPLTSPRATMGFVAPAFAGRYKVLLCLLVAAFATEFLARGPVRFLETGVAFNDFIPPFVQAKALVRGLDPYAPQTLLLLWPKDSTQFGFLSKDVAAGTIEAKDGIPSPYPLSCLAVLAPISLIPWHVVRIALLALNVISSLLLIAILLSLAKVGLPNPRTYVFVALALSLAPLHTAIAGANLIVLVCACGAGAIWFAEHNRNTLPGVLLAVGICLKPPVGIVFLVYEVMRRRWHVALVALGLSALITAAGILRLWVSGVNWVGSYLANINKMFATGAINDFTRANPLRFHLLNLQMPIYSLTSSVSAANQITWLIVAALSLAWVRLMWRSRGHCGLLDLSAIAVIALLPSYHRFVDGLLLMLPLCWCVTVRVKELKAISRLVMFLLLPFLVPGASLLVALAEKGVLPSALVTGRWWDAVLVPHEIWATLCISIALLYAMRLRRAVTLRELKKHDECGVSHPCAALVDLPQT